MTQVLIKRKRLSRKLITVNSHQYLFSTKVNLNIAWVDESDVNAVLALKESCCGGSKKPGYVKPTDSEIHRWMNA